jgi:hypothetical protein
MMMFGMMPPTSFMMVRGRITVIVTITATSRITTGITHHIVALGLLLLLVIVVTRILMTMREPAVVTGDTHDVIDPHTTCKEGHRQKETYDEHGNHHEHPRNGFQVTKAERLKCTSSYDTDEEPPEGGLVASRQQMVDNTGNG